MLPTTACLVRVSRSLPPTRTGYTTYTYHHLVLDHCYTTYYHGLYAFRGTTLLHGFHTTYTAPLPLLTIPFLFYHHHTYCARLLLLPGGVRFILLSTSFWFYLGLVEHVCTACSAHFSAPGSFCAHLPPRFAPCWVRCCLLCTPACGRSTAFSRTPTPRCRSRNLSAASSRAYWLPPAHHNLFVLSARSPALLPGTPAFLTQCTPRVPRMHLLPVYTASNRRAAAAPCLPACLLCAYAYARHAPRATVYYPDVLPSLYPTATILCRFAVSFTMPCVPCRCGFALLLLFLRSCRCLQLTAFGSLLFSTICPTLCLLGLFWFLTFFWFLPILRSVPFWFSLVHMLPAGSSVLPRYCASTTAHIYHHARVSHLPALRAACYHLHLPAGYHLRSACTLLCCSSRTLHYHGSPHTSGLDYHAPHAALLLFWDFRFLPAYYILATTCTPYYHACAMYQHLPTCRLYTYHLHYLLPHCGLYHTWIHRLPFPTCRFLHLLHAVLLRSYCCWLRSICTYSWLFLPAVILPGLNFTLLPVAGLRTTFGLRGSAVRVRCCARTAGLCAFLRACTRFRLHAKCGGAYRHNITCTHAPCALCCCARNNVFVAGHYNARMARLLRKQRLHCGSGWFLRTFRHQRIPPLWFLAARFHLACTRIPCYTVLLNAASFFLHLTSSASACLLLQIFLLTCHFSYTHSSILLCIPSLIRFHPFFKFLALLRSYYTCRLPFTQHFL